MPTKMSMLDDKGLVPMDVDQVTVKGKDWLEMRGLERKRTRWKEG